MAEPGLDPADVEAPSPARPTAASVIAELWSEREQSIQAAAPPVPVAPPPRRDSRAGVVAVIAVALVLGAGAGVLLEARSAGPPSREKYARNADGVCRPANAAVSALTKPSSYPDLASATGTLVTASDTQLAGLRRLHAPGGADGDRVRTLLSTMTQANQAGHSLQDAAGRKDDTATATATQQMRTSSAAATSQAKDLGLAACVTGMRPTMDNVLGGAAGIVKTAFVAKADTVCRAAARAMDAVRPPRSDSRDVARALGEIIPIAEKMVADLKALPVPPGDENVISEAMTAEDKQTAKAKEARDALLANDRSRYLATDQELSTLGTAADAKLDAYGLTSCGSNFGSR